MKPRNHAGVFLSFRVAAALGLFWIALADCPAAVQTPKPTTGEKAAEPVAKLDPRKRAELGRRGLELAGKKEYAKAIEAFEEILKADPEDAAALYNLACVLALTGDKPGALDRLRKAVENGFVDFSHIAQDHDLDSLRGAAAYKALFARKAEYVRKARERATNVIVEYLAHQKIAAGAYKSFFDEERRLVYLHAKPDAEFAEWRRGIQDFADGLWRMLFKHKPEMPLYIVLLNDQDALKVMPPGVGGFYRREANTLFCCERPASQLLKASIVFHEFTHGLHYADQAALRQEHPIWIVEGLATLFESSRREKDTVTPLPSFRLSVIQLAAKSGGTVPWETFVKLDQGRFVGNANLCYGQARCMLFYIHEKGLLKAFYDEYVNASNFERDKTGLEAIETVFGRTAAEVERDWLAWAVKQQVAVAPFLGVVTEEKKPVIDLPDGSPSAPGALKVRSVIPQTPAAASRIRAGDVIVSVEGTPVHTRDDLMEAVGNRKTGETITIRLEREGQPIEVTATLTARPETTGLPPGAPLPEAGPAKPRNPQGPRAGFAVSQTDGGVVVRDLDKDSPAAKAGIGSGWRILKFDQAEMKTVRDFLAAVKRSKPGATVELAVRQPDGQEAVVKFEMGAIPPVTGD